MNWIGLLAILAILWIAQEAFLEIHRRRHGLWRSARERRFLPSRDERVVMWGELTRRNADAAVERARLAFVAIVVLCLAAVLLVLAAGGALRPSP
jgi:hypothetical protein